MSHVPGAFQNLKTAKIAKINATFQNEINQYASIGYQALFFGINTTTTATASWAIEVPFGRSR